MECINRFNEKLSMGIPTSWEYSRVIIGGISFDLNEDVIFKATRIFTKGHKWKKSRRVVDNDSINQLFYENEKLVKIHGSFNSEDPSIL